jgi:hypothetical protein
MELVEGEDLAERLKRGPVAVDEALGTVRQIALKPANVKVTPEAAP